MTHSDLSILCQKWGNEIGIEVEVRQSDSEETLISWINEAIADQIPVILNPAAFTHYSLGLAKACAARKAPLIEVHISNPHTREEFRKRSVISEFATGTIAGFGANSYKLALMQIAELSK